MSIAQFLTDLDAEVEAGWVNEKRNGDLSLFNYSQECQMAGHWNKTTRQCRGLIMDRKAKKIVARPFKKFFNLNENDWSTMDKFPLWDDSEVEVTTKLDGSLGIITLYNGELLVTTRGSFESEQAIWAKQFIEDNWDLDALVGGYTYLAEIIYPNNRIVVDYSGHETVTLLGIVCTDMGWEMNLSQVRYFAQEINAEVVDAFKCKGFEELLKLKEELDFNTEGWVIHFVKTNQRVKIKTDDYCRLHRIISNLSPLAMWESMKKGKADPNYLNQIPEEFKKEVQWMQDALEEQYAYFNFEIDVAYFGVRLGVGHNRKHDRSYFKDMSSLIVPIKNEIIRGGCFAMMRNKSVDTLIMNAIRPDSNIVRNIPDATTDKVL